MTAVRLREHLILVSGATLRAGTVLYVGREFQVRTADGDGLRWSLVNAFGVIVVPQIDPAHVDRVE